MKKLLLLFITVIHSKAHYTLDISLMDNYDKIKDSIDKLKELLNLKPQTSNLKSE